MEENIFNALPGFDRMLEQKPFKALSTQEKELVLKFITAEDYNQFREAVLATQRGKFNGDPPITPDPSVKIRLMQTLGATDKSLLPSPAGILSGFLKYRIPLYQAGLAASVLLFFVFYLFLQNYHTRGEVAVTDTVYVARPILMRDTVWLTKPDVKNPGGEKTLHRHTGTRNATAAQSLPENSLYASQMQDAMSRMSVISGLGKDKSVNHDARLMKLVTVGMATITSP